jgi:hypothetical protein
MTRDGRNASLAPMSDVSVELCALISAQITCARDGDLAQVERLCARVDDMVARMKEGSADRSVAEPQRMRLRQLYEELILTLRTGQADTEARLKQLRRVKRAVGTYGGRVRP